MLCIYCFLIKRKKLLALPDTFRFIRRRMKITRQIQKEYSYDRTRHVGSRIIDFLENYHARKRNFQGNTKNDRSSSIFKAPS